MREDRKVPLVRGGTIRTMEPLKRNSYDDALAALRDAMRILEHKSLQKADAGACLWVSPSGEKICARLTPGDCAKITGAVFIGGPFDEVIEKLKGME